MLEGHPIDMTSKALDETQSNYAVIENELLAMCFECHRSREYSCGNLITIEADHKPRVSMMQKPLFPLLARMRMRLQKYNLNVMYVKGKNMYFAGTIPREYINRPEDPISVADIGLGQNSGETINDLFLREVIEITNILGQSILKT